jgi:predicted secreted protein
MKKKKSKTKKIKEEVSKPLSLPSEEPNFDFGGLGARDLKKNLGCG